MPLLRFARRPLTPAALLLMLGSLGWLVHGRWLAVDAAPRPEVATLGAGAAAPKDEPTAALPR